MHGEDPPVGLGDDHRQESDSGIEDLARFRNCRGRLTTNLDGVSVSVAGRPAFVYYISPTKLTSKLPRSSTFSLPAGTEVEVGVTSPDCSAVAVAKFTPVAPALLACLLDGQTHAAAVHPDGVLVGREAAIPGTVKRGEAR